MTAKRMFYNLNIRSTWSRARRSPSRRPRRSRARSTSESSRTTSPRTISGNTSPRCQSNKTFLLFSSSGLFRKYQISLINLAWDKHSSLLWPLVTGCGKISQCSSLNIKANSLWQAPGFFAITRSWDKHTSLFGLKSLAAEKSASVCPLKLRPGESGRLQAFSQILDQPYRPFMGQSLAGPTTFSITTFSITTFSITTFSLVTLSMMGSFATLTITDSV